MSGALIPIWRYQAIANGVPQSGAKLYTYLSGSSTPQATYTTPAMNISHANPVVADSAGLFPAIYLAPVTYRVTLTTSAGATLIAAQDGVSDIGQLDQATVATLVTDVADLQDTVDDLEPLIPVYSTWTPVLGGAGGTSGQTYANQHGYAIKLGKLVIAQCYILLTAKGTITGNAQISGLPYASSSETDQYWTASVSYTTLLTNWVNVIAQVSPSMSVAYLLGAQSATVSNTTPLTTSDIANTTAISVTLTYKAAA